MPFADESGKKVRQKVRQSGKQTAAEAYGAGQAGVMCPARNFGVAGPRPKTAFAGPLGPAGRQNPIVPDCFAGLLQANTHLGRRDDEPPPRT
jgi:hypothetical protein